MPLESSSTELLSSSANATAAVEQKTFTVSVRDVSVKPRILLFEHFLSDGECDAIVALGKQKMQPSKVADPLSGDPVDDAARSSRGAFFDRGVEPLLTYVEDRIAALTQIPAVNGEGFQILHYDVGQQYKPHWDYFPLSMPGSKPNLARGGQRVATMLFYLNHVEAGGDTSFPYVGLKVIPRKGTALLFYNVMPDGEIEPLSFHGADPVITGEKWVLTKWMRESKFT